MRTRTVLGAAIIAVGALFLGKSGQALDISRSGTTLMLSGPIFSGDDIALRDALASAPTRVIYLNSPGGFIATAGEMGRLIREQHLTTVVDAARARCLSACTVLFASGTTRLYLNADRLTEGPMPIRGFTGLGYHSGSSTTSLDSNRYSGAGTSYLIDYYYEFGSPAAADLVTKAPPNVVYRVSGPTAVAMGLATGTGRP
ncbi:hypothetical protein [Methylovirgula sp. 4M-Z18]|uniref:hypothetical protein n=1 Tax=Methylovirgula sp. 4M-Z18 TaxID=2293567 RepID=UPI000E2F9FFD|nr:hypothetical protein [Methylovirgula sp. 4M-Z18]RFB79363.1 hypothetical protein DYH55_12500 [Methylovirgula sp. 4M-Z18]